MAASLAGFPGTCLDIITVAGSANESQASQKSTIWTAGFDPFHLGQPVLGLPDF